MASDGGEVTVEFFGIPRQRAGRPELKVSAGTVGEVLAQVQEECPNLRLLDRRGRVVKEYLLSINGQRFVSDYKEPLQPGEHVLLLSADAGG